MSRCTYCGAENPDAARFCGSCGRTGQSIQQTEQGKLLTIDEPHETSQKPADGNTNRERQKTVQGDVVLPIGLANTASAGTHVPTLQGTPQLGQMPTVQGVPSTPQPAGNAAPTPAAHAPATSAPQAAHATHIPHASTSSQATHAAHVPSHVSGASATHAQHTGATHAQDQFKHSQPGHSAAQNVAAHAAVKGGISGITKIIATIIAAAVIVAGGAGAFAIAHQHQSGNHVVASPNKHTATTPRVSATSASIKPASNTFTLTGAVNGTLSQVNFTICSQSPQIPAYSLDFSGTLDNQVYSLVLDISNNDGQAGTFTFPNSANYAAELSTATQAWGGTEQNIQGQVTINTDGVSGILSNLTFPGENGTTGQVTLNGYWLCPTAPGGQATPTSPSTSASNVFTVSGAVSGTLTLTSYITCGMTPSGSAVGGIATGTLNGQTYHMNFLFPHYHGPGTYIDPSSPGNVTMNFNDGTHTWSTNGSDAQGSATVNSDNNSGSFSSFTVPGINGESGTHITIDGSWSCS